jgi:hypothetical protein
MKSNDRRRNRVPKSAGRRDLSAIVSLSAPTRAARHAPGLATTHRPRRVMTETIPTKKQFACTQNSMRMKRVHAAPQASHKAQTCSLCCSRPGEGGGARGGPGPSGAPLFKHGPSSPGGKTIEVARVNHGEESGKRWRKQRDDGDLKALLTPPSLPHDSKKVMNHGEQARRAGDPHPQDHDDP